MRIVTAVAILLCAGCGGVVDRPQLAPVSGVVMMDGKPLADVNVTFYFDGEQAPRPAVGTTDESGKFRLTTFDTNDGAIVGTHIVTVTKIEKKADAANMEIGGDAYTAAMNAAANPNAPPPKQLLPSKFATKDTSPLRVTVDAAGKDGVQLILE